MNKFKRSGWVAFLAIIIFVYGLIIKKDIAYFFLSDGDTVYTYLLNGLSVATGNWQLGTLADPGLILTALYAVVILIVGLFRPLPVSIDVLDNPEVYLSAISFVFIVAFSVLIFWILKQMRSKQWYTQSLFIIALLLLPFALITNLPFPAPEGLVALFFIIILFIQLKSDQSPTIATGVLSGLSIATLFAAWPIFLFNLLLIKGNKKRIRYLIIGGLTFLLGISPALKTIVKEQFWIPQFLPDSVTTTNHTPFVLWIKNLIELITTDSFLLLAIILTIVNLILLKIRKVRSEQIKYAAILTGIYLLGIIWISAFGHAAFILPYQLMIIAALFISIVALEQNTQIGQLISKQGWFFVAFMFFVFLFYRNIKHHPFQYAQKYRRFQTVEYFDRNKSEEFLLINNDHTPLKTKEAALYRAFTHTAGWSKDNYEIELANLYPNIAFYHHDYGLYDWNGSLSAMEFGKNEKGLVLFPGTDSLTTDIELKNRLLMTIPLKLYEEFKNELSHEKIFRYTTSIEATKEIAQFNCGFENIASGKIKDSSQQFTLGDETNLIKKNSLKGKQAIQLTKEYPFALNYEIYLEKQGYMEVTIYRKSEENRGLLVLQSIDNDQFYQTSSRVISEEGDWQKMQITFDIDKQLVNQKLRLYLWNNGSKPVLFDNLCINYFEGSL